MEGPRQRLRNPEGRARKILERASTSLILVALGTAPLEAMPGMSEEWRQAITWLELGILGIFTAEYVLRLWIAERPWKYALSFYGLIDLAAIRAREPSPSAVSGQAPCARAARRSGPRAAARPTGLRRCERGSVQRFAWRL